MQREQVATRRLSALLEAGMVLASELDLDALLHRIADLAREVIGARYGAVGVLGEQGELVRFVYSGLTKEDADRIGHLPEGRGVLGAIIHEGRPLRLRDIADHPRSYGFPEHHPPMRSFLGVPITVRGRIFGRLYLTEKQGGPEFTKDDERIAMTFAAQAGTAIENARLYDEVRSRDQDLAILEERDRISKELHDGVIQSIYSVGLSLQGAISFLNRDAERAKTRVQDAIAELDNVVRDVRSYIFELRPHLMKEKGLASAIRGLAREHEVNTLAEVSVDIDEDACGAFTEREQSHAFHFVRETLSNIARHGQAAHLSIHCHEKEDTVVIAIEDDGVGFDPASVARGHGLDNMEARAHDLGARLEILPRIPKGMRVALYVPRNGGDGE